MKKKLLPALLLTAGVLMIIYGLSGSFKSDKENSQKALKIGMILPLSGDNAILGLDMKEGAEFLKSSQKYNRPYEIIYEDDQMKSTFCSKPWKNQKIITMKARLAEHCRRPLVKTTIF